MPTYHIHIKGIVQGVGFRPFVYKYAQKLDLKGWVNNTTDGVHIRINADKKNANDFLRIMLDHLPPLAVVTDWSIDEVNFVEYDDFQIIHSKSEVKPNLLLTPDVAMCKDCRAELHDKQNRRYQYPFITCTNCGPRYSIIKKLPYDRPTTSMAKFEMCDVCFYEYNNPLERRHFSQTNSCADCPVEMQLFENRKLTEHFNDLDHIISRWKQGKIIAIKGIGGYLLTCDATNAKAIQILRQRKYRPTKPFALMYPNLKSIAQDAVLGEDEIKELESIQAPIVLLEAKEKQESDIAIDEINHGLSRIGIMLPYTPLYDLLLSKFNKPIVATSGNITNSTIIYEDEQARIELLRIADLILMNNREIIIPQDDAVVQFSGKYRQKIILRRSRGKAPIYINPDLQVSNKSILATGSMLKSVFGMLDKQNIYISQYLGNTESHEAQLNYEKTFKHLVSVLQPDIDLVVTDKHPDYFSTRFGKEYSENNKIDLINIQHHKAHFYSVLGENNLLSSDAKILGVVWDGTGLGDDGNIWGGEFFVYDGKQMERVAHLDEFDFILSDKMVKEPRISALAIAHNILGTEKYLKPKFSSVEWQVYHKLLEKPKLKSTSMGRLFDAVSSLLFNNDFHNFEAEASMRLEQKATGYMTNNSVKLSDSYLSDESSENFVHDIISGIISDMDNNLNKALIAAKFHISLVHYLIRVARKLGFRHIAFSGGVFQNTLLIDMIIEHMKDEYFLYFHKEFSPNDEGIPFGQLIYGLSIDK